MSLRDQIERLIEQYKDRAQGAFSDADAAGIAGGNEDALNDTGFAYLLIANELENALLDTEED